MKWFKHFAMAHTDDKIVSIRAKFGMWGIGTYWTLVERAAEQMKGNTPSPSASLLVPELCSFLGCKRNKLETFLEHLQNIRGMNYKLNGDILEINVPKLLEIKDNYHTDLEETSKTLPSKEVDVEVEVDKKKKDICTHPRFTPPSLDEVVKHFEEIGGHDGEGFFNYYESNGWRVGRNPMKNWKSSARNWKRNEGKFNGNGKGKSSNPNSQAARASYHIDQAGLDRLRNLKATLDERDRERGQCT